MLFEDLALPTKGIKKTTRKDFRLVQVSLKKLEGQHPVIEMIKEYQAGFKVAFNLYFAIT